MNPTSPTKFVTGITIYKQKRSRTPKSTMDIPLLNLKIKK